jgi:hypothetical protein
MNSGNKLLRLVESIDEIACEYKIVIVELIAEIASISLPEVTLMRGGCETVLGERRFFKAKQVAFIAYRVTLAVVLFDLSCCRDKTRRKIDTNDVIEFACNLETCTTNRTAEIQRTARLFFRRLLGEVFEA